jgi:hypothetical protein
MKVMLIIICGIELWEEFFMLLNSFYRYAVRGMRLGDLVLPQTSSRMPVAAYRSS